MTELLSIIAAAAQRLLEHEDDEKVREDARIIIRAVEEMENEKENPVKEKTNAIE